MTAQSAEPEDPAAVDGPEGAGGADRSRPDVSLIIPTYNSRPLLAVALDAVAAQTLPPDRIEVVVVDDGSTDDTWAYLTALAERRPGLRIHRQPNSGRPSVGRNRGLALATGRYVFFHDADDYLAPDALRRMVEFADRHESDVVVGRLAPVGRPHEPQPPGSNLVDADLVTDRVWRSLAPQKLFRRALIDRLELTFPEDQVQGEDQVFVAACLFAARRVSLLRDIDYYFRRLREDGQNISSQPQSLENKTLTTSRMCRVVTDNTAPGEQREQLLERVMLRTLGPAVNKPFQRADPAERDAFLTTVRRDVLPHLSENLLAKAKQTVRMRLLTARDGSASQLLELNDRIAAGLRAHVETPPDGSPVLCFDLGADLNALLSAEVRRLEELVTLSPPRLMAVKRARRGALRASVLVTSPRVDVDEVGLVVGAGRRRGDVLLDRQQIRGDLVQLRVVGGAPGLIEPVAAGRAPAPRPVTVRCYQRDVLVAESPLEWSDDPAAEVLVRSRSGLLRPTPVVTLQRGPEGEVLVSVRPVTRRLNQVRRALARRLRRAPLIGRRARTRRADRAGSIETS